MRRNSSEAAERGKRQEHSLVGGGLAFKIAILALLLAVLLILVGSAVAKADEAVGEIELPHYTPMAPASADEPSLAPSSTARRSGPTPYDHGDPSDIEQYFLEMINRARFDPAGEADRFGIGLNDGLSGTPISSAPKQPLVFNPNLLAAARGHSAWMLDSNTFSHTGAGGSAPADRTRAAGYPHYAAIGENIAWRGWTSPAEPHLVEYAEFQHEGLFKSSPHRLNTLRPEWRETGVGGIVGIFSTSGNHYHALMTTQNFGESNDSPACATGSRFLTGVVYEDRDGDGFYSPGEGVAGVVVEPLGYDFFAVSSTSGGYAVPIPGATGVIEVLVHGAPWTSPQRYDIQSTGDNLKLDVLVVPADEVAISLMASGGGSTQPAGTLTVGSQEFPLPVAAIPDAGAWFLAWDDPSGVLADATSPTTTLSSTGEATVTALFSGGDFDGDRLPDEWEFGHFGDLGANPEDDINGDGHTNYVKSLAGLDPHTDHSHLAALILYQGWNVFVPPSDMDGKTIAEALGDKVEPAVWKWDAQKRTYVRGDNILSPQKAAWILVKKNVAIFHPLR